MDDGGTGGAMHKHSKCGSRKSSGRIFSPTAMAWDGFIGIANGTTRSAIRNGHAISSGVTFDNIIGIVPQEPE